ncbi:DNA-processing protein DprA [Sporosarcina cyprini]|uniref:DNA-processing protein DprA n=1 Tax=Sporosarcina cyprini TaxID=2910523 RepID=UPI001EE04E5E|nr:DNA-processing protein DprA [Sporosarcina cyprini]MCG3090115.1 DNA-processing protein DprA [Sporosarcina cyprini]
MYSPLERQLLRLHYIYPVPWNRIQPLFEIDPELERLAAMKPELLSRLLRLPISKAERLSDRLRELDQTPLDRLYRQEGITPIPITHSHYPNDLKRLIDPPAVLYAKGDTTLFSAPAKISIIGSRKASEYSRTALSMIVPPLVKHGIVIVSGLAKGADALAHEAAIEYGGQTIAVLGSGHFHVYPKENAMLASRIAKDHLLVTEYPPYVQPARWTFPMRNRIISGLADAVVVTESAERSGTMSTVEHALDHGKVVYAVPGPITSPLSIGPNKLIEEGANPVWNGFQIIETAF